MGGDIVNGRLDVWGAIQYRLPCVSGLIMKADLIDVACCVKRVVVDKSVCVCNE